MLAAPCLLLAGAAQRCSERQSLAAWPACGDLQTQTIPQWDTDLYAL